MKTELLKELAKLKSEKKELDIKINNVESKLKELENNDKLTDGFDPYLVKFYSYVIPTNNKNDYMSQCISSKGLELFEKFVNIDDFDRYKIYSFSKEIESNIFYYIEKEYYEEQMREEVIQKFLNKKLKSFDSLYEDEIELIKEIITCIYSIYSDSFKYDC